MDRFLPYVGKAAAGLCAFAREPGGRLFDPTTVYFFNPTDRSKMLKHVKRHWNETRGDQHDCWGTSWWYFEIADDGQVTRQVEQYESGALLHYDAKRNVDAYGGLASEPLNLSESAYLEISDQEFEQVWESAIKSENVL